MARLACVLIGVFAVACGGNNNATHSCGDGIVNGTEECDDGNTVSGDGCSSVCKKEVGMCGDGIVDVATETCDDGNRTDGDGCSANCQIETSAKCGNGVVDTGEGCDDHNTAGGDGCSAACQVETGYTCTGAPSVCTMMGTQSGAGTCAMPIAIALTGTTVLTGIGSGDTTSSTDQVDGQCAGLDDSGNDQILTFTLPTAGPTTITLDETFDGEVRLLTAPCDVTTAVTDANNTEGCADNGYEGDREVLKYTNLPAGTYYVVVDSYDPTELGTYTVTVSSGQDCGNGHLEGTEECDDGNHTPGDRCSATCTLESDVAEVEPNDTTAQVITPANHIVRGSLTDGDADLFTFTLTAPATLELETYDTIDLDSPYLGVSMLTQVDCAYDNTQLSLFDSTGDVTDDGTALWTTYYDGDYDDVTFLSGCAYLGPLNSDDDATEGVLQPGTYTIKVEDSFGGTDARYALDIHFTTSTTAVAPVAGDLVINEAMLADGTTADTNCDGSTTSTNDEFVEIANVSNHAVDLTGVTLWDAASLVMTTPAPRHMFAAATSGSMTLDPGKVVVVWGGGAPACAGVTDWFVASSGGLGLNDTGGETITLKIGDATSTTLATATFGDATTGKSFNLNPDLTGAAFALHDAITGHVGAFSPGKKTDGTAF